MAYIKNKFINSYNIIKINTYNIICIMLEREKKENFIIWSKTLRTIFDNNNENKEDTGNIIDQDIAG